MPETAIYWDDVANHNQKQEKAPKSYDFDAFFVAVQHYRCSGEAGLDYIFAFGENQSVAAVETGGKQMSTGHLHLMGSSPFPFHARNKGHPLGMSFIFGGRGGT